MTTIHQQPYGFDIVLEGDIDLEDVQRLQFQLRDEWAGIEPPFSLMVDARRFKLFTADAQALFEGLLEEAVASGLAKITVIAVSTGFAGLFCTIMMRTELMEFYQYMDTAYEPDWKDEVEPWLMEPLLQHGAQDDA